MGDDDTTDSGGGQFIGDDPAKPSTPRDENGSVFEFSLAFFSEVMHPKLPFINLSVFLRQWNERLQ